MSCKVFVGGVSSSTEDDTLRKHFEKYGAVADAVVMRERGFGFVTFEERQAANDAIDDKHVIDGQTLSVKEAVGKGKGGGGKGGDTRSGGGGAPGSGPATDKVFVGGLPQDCSDAKVRDYFSTYGTIVDAVVMKDRETGRSRGFGFVQYDNTASVDKVIAEYPDHKLEGKWVEVKRSVPRDQMPAPAPPPAAPRGDYGQGGGAGAYGAYGGPPPMGAYGAYGAPGYSPYGGYAAAYGGAYGGYSAYGAPYGYPGPPPNGGPPPGAYGAPAYGGYGGYPYGPSMAPPPRREDSRERPY